MQTLCVCVCRRWWRCRTYRQHSRWWTITSGCQQWYALNQSPFSFQCTSILRSGRMLSAFSVQGFPLPAEKIKASFGMPLNFKTQTESPRIVPENEKTTFKSLVEFSARASQHPMKVSAISTNTIRQAFVQHCRTSDLELTAICCVKLQLSFSTFKSRLKTHLFSTALC